MKQDVLLYYQLLDFRHELMLIYLRSHIYVHYR
ncbi:hypothetical protein [Bacillus atrophaeus]